jgi:hypothetical protein
LQATPVEQVETASAEVSPSKSSVDNIGSRDPSVLEAK